MEPTTTHTSGTQTQMPGSTPGESSGISQTMNDAMAETKSVAGDAKQQIRSVVDQGRSEIREQFTQRSQQLSDGMERFAAQLRGLAEGHPEEAGNLQRYLTDAEQRLTTWSQKLRTGGPDMVLGDVRSMARRRPGIFLLGAVGAGFVVGRLVRVGMSAPQAQEPSTRTPDPWASPSMTSDLPGNGSLLGAGR